MPGGTYAGGKAFQGINNHGDAVGMFTPGAYSYQTTYSTLPWVWLRNAEGGRDEYDANDLLPLDSEYTVLAVYDINDSRDIVGICATPAGDTHGCILHVTDPLIPEDSVKPKVRIDSPPRDAPVSGTVTIAASAWDDWSRIDKVVFKVGRTRLKVDRSAPFTAQWDTTGYAPGSYTLRAIAIDKAGNASARKVIVSLVATAPALPPTDPAPPPAGEVVESEGTISAGQVLLM